MAKESDFEFVNGVVVRAEEKKTTGGDAALRVEERHAATIWAASGIIGNGGFQYFFEHGLSGEAATESYESIGMPKTADIFRTALSLFPGGRPPADWPEALAFIRSKGELFAKLSEEVWSSEAEMVPRLATYLRAAGIR